MNAEFYHKALRYGFTDSDYLAQTIVWMEWELQAVLDLTIPALRREMGIAQRAILGCDWNGEQTLGTEPLTQAIARAAFEHLVEGLVVPSARYPGGINVVYFPCHRRDGSVIRTLDEDSIPRVPGL